MKFIIYLFLMLPTFYSYSNEVEVLHWWTSNGEKSAANVLINQFKNQNMTWVDSSVPGGGGDTAMLVLQTKAIANSPPMMAQIEGKHIKTWAKFGYLVPLTTIAKDNNWHKKLPHIAKQHSIHNNKFIAIPINLHRINWLWSNKQIFDELQISPPTNWDDFFSIADILYKKNILPLAIGNEKWQLAILFENLVLGIGGSEFFNSLLVKMEINAIESHRTIDILKKFKAIKKYINIENKSLSWDKATQKLIENKAAMQIMGDWAKGELIFHKKKPNIDFYCTPAPGTSNAFIYNIDSFVIFKDDKVIVSKIAKLLMDKDFQKEFSLKKGSIPIRNDINITQFDYCAKQSLSQFKLAEKTTNLLPSVTDSMAISSQKQEALLDTLYRYFNNESITTAHVLEQMKKISKSRY